MNLTKTSGDVVKTRPDDAEHAVDVAAVQAAIDRGLMQGALRRYDEYVELEALLCGHLRRLLVEAEPVVDRMWRGSVEWYQRRTALDTIQNDAATSRRGNGLQSAHNHVVRLARHCRYLLDLTGRNR